MNNYHRYIFLVEGNPFTPILIEIELVEKKKLTKEQKSNAKEEWEELLEKGGLALLPTPEEVENWEDFEPDLEGELFSDEENGDEKETKRIEKGIVVNGGYDMNVDLKNNKAWGHGLHASFHREVPDNWPKDYEQVFEKAGLGFPQWDKL